MKELSIRARMIEDDEERDLVIADGVIAEARPVPGTEPDAAGWVLPGLADVHNHLSLASPAGEDPDPGVRVRAESLLAYLLLHRDVPQPRQRPAFRVRDAYGDEKYARLVAPKDTYDPANLFRLNRNIRPSQSAEPVLA